MAIGLRENAINGQTKKPVIFQSPLAEGGFDLGDPSTFLCHLDKYKETVTTYGVTLDTSKYGTGYSATFGFNSTAALRTTHLKIVVKRSGSSTSYGTLYLLLNTPIPIDQLKNLRFALNITGSMTYYNSSSLTTTKTVNFTLTQPLDFESFDVYATDGSGNVTEIAAIFNYDLVNNLFAKYSDFYGTPANGITINTAVGIDTNVKYDDVAVTSIKKDYVIPISNNTNHITFEIDSTNRFIATDKDGTVVVLMNATAVLDTYGIDIIKIWYLSIDVIMVIWTYQQNATTGGYVYMKILDLDATANGKLHGTAARILFASAARKLSRDDPSNIPYVYSGSIHKFDFRNGEWAIGINYIRASVNASAVTLRKDGWFGEIGIYTNTAASNRILFQTVQTSRLAYLGSAGVSSGADLWFEESHGNVLSFGAMTSASVRSFTRYVLMVANDALGTNPYANSSTGSPDISKDYRWLGRLEDGTYVVHNLTDNKLAIYNWQPVRAGNVSKWILLNEISISSIPDLMDQTQKPLLLKSGVLLGKECLWQFIFNTTTSTYGIEKIGKYKKQDLPNTYVDDTTNNIRTIYGHYAIPLGRFSDLAEGLGSGDVQANLSTT